MIQNKNHDIALWGPPRSGKTSFLKACIKEFKWFNASDPDYFYELTDQKGNYISDIPNEHYYERIVVSRLWRLCRISKAESKKIITWNLDIHEIPGETPLVINTGVNQQYCEWGSSAIINSMCTIALLDPTKLLGNDLFSNNDPNKTMEADRIDQEKYADYIMQLGSLIETAQSSDGNKRYIAICITKLDTIGLRHDPWKLIRMFFGNNMYQVLKRHKNKIRLEVFATSSIGFEFDEMINLWQPFNVVAPLFWLFNEITLTSSGEKEIYPQPRL